jgi:pimeloyl-ACP methyl ester carboxylesterase
VIPVDALRILIVRGTETVGVRAREEIEIAMYVWHGDADRNVPFANGVYQASAIPHATLHRVPDEGHWIHYTHFDEILACLAA